jgi:serine/threonine-protein kinase RsbW
MLIPRKLRAYVEQHEGDEIRLTIPATADAVRIARVGAAGLGTRLGFSFSEVEELRLAVGEAAGLLAANPSGQMLDVTYVVQPDGLRVTIALEGGDDGAATAPDVPMLTMSVLDTVVDAWKLDHARPSIELYKIPADRAHGRADQNHE